MENLTRLNYCHGCNKVKPTLFRILKANMMTFRVIPGARNTLLVRVLCLVCMNSKTVEMAQYGWEDLENHPKLEFIV